MAQFQTVIQNAKRGFDNMGPGLNALTQALANFIAAASSFFPGSVSGSRRFRTSSWRGLSRWASLGLRIDEPWLGCDEDSCGYPREHGRDFLAIVKAASGGAAGMEEFNRKLEAMKQKLATPEMQTGLRDMFNGAKQGLDFIQQALGISSTSFRRWVRLSAGCSLLRAS